MQRVFVRAKTTHAPPLDTISVLRSAPGVASVEKIQNDQTVQLTQLYFCKIADDSFRQFKGFITKKIPTDIVFIKKAVAL